MKKRYAVTLVLVALVVGAGDGRAMTFVPGPRAMNNPFFGLARDGCQKVRFVAVETAMGVPPVDAVFVGVGEFFSAIRHRLCV